MVQNLVAARDGMHVEVARLGAVRSESSASHRDRLDSRLIDLICRELLIEFAADGKGPGPGGGANTDLPRPIGAGATAAPTVVPLPAGASNQPPASPAEDAAVRAASAVELIEKIDLFVRSQRPALAMTLAGGLGARVEIERLGPKEVAVKVQGKRGPPAPEELTRIREEIRARGLKLAALTVG